MQMLIRWIPDCLAFKHSQFLNCNLQEIIWFGRKEMIWPARSTFHPVLPSFSAFCLSALSVSLPDLCGHCCGVTGACSYTIPVTQREEWPPVSPSLSFLPDWQACLFLSLHVGRHLRSHVKCSTIHQDGSDHWGMRTEVSLTSLTFKDQKYDRVVKLCLTKILMALEPCHS